MANPLVSIIVPCFNSEGTLRKCIDSALTQDYAERELIIIDDGSRDHSRDIIREYGDAVRHRFQENLGAGAARNVGTSLAEGEFLLYLDADDLLVPGTVSSRVAALTETGGQVAYTGWQELHGGPADDAGLAEVFDADIASVSEDPQVALFTRFWSPPAALLYARSVVDRIGGWREDLRIIQDARFALDAAIQGARFVRVPGVGALYRVDNGSSLSRRDPERFAHECLLNTMEVEDLWTREGSLSSERRRALRDSYDFSSRWVFYEDEGLFSESLTRLREYGGARRGSWPWVAAAAHRLLGMSKARQLMQRLKAH